MIKAIEFIYLRYLVVILLFSSCGQELVAKNTGNDVINDHDKNKISYSSSKEDSLDLGRYKESNFSKSLKIGSRILELDIALVIIISMNLKFNALKNHRYLW